MSACVSVPGGPGICPCAGTSRYDGLWPTTPQQCDGLRIEPPMSEPSSSGVKPAASAPAEPPDDPPGLRVVSQGLFD